MKTSKQQQQNEVADAEFEAPSLPVVQRKPPSLAVAPGAGVSEWHHNFDLTTWDGRAALMNAGNVPDWIPSDGETLRMDVVHYACFPDQYIDRQTGEVVECTACVLIDKHGKTARFLNEWSLRRLHAAMQMFTKEEWAAGIPIELFSAPSRQPGRRYGSFRIVAQKPTSKE